MTYPPEPVNGVMVTGLGTPDRQVFTFPAALSDDLRSNGYRVNKSVFYRPGAEAAFLKDTYDQTQRVADAALDLLVGREWDFGMVVFRDTDELAHFFWKHMDASHPEHNPAIDPPYRNALLDYYKYLDTLTGKLIEAVGPETDIIVMSDHGMGPLYKDVYLNEWLRQNDLLATRVDLKQPQGGRLAQLGLTSSNVSRLLQSIGLARFERWLRLTMGTSKRWLPANNRASFPEAIDWSRTQAYSYGYHGQLFLNVKGREAEGVVEPGESYFGRRAAMKRALEELIDPEDKKPVVSDIIFQEDAFNGPYAVNGPDLVIVMRDLAYITRHGYEFGGRPGYIFNKPASHESGSHRLHGMVFLHGSGFGGGVDISNCSILDLAPTIMQLFGLSVPEQMEGAPLVHNVGLGNSVDVTMDRYEASRAGSALPEAAELTEEDEKELSERLKNLGYLE
jgi:predicted AlkP superfamily phosphohydrolase/phosphomutase